MTIRNTDSCIFFNCDSWDKDCLEDFFFWPCHMARGILLPRPGMEPVSLQGKHGVPATGQPGNSLLWRLSDYWIDKSNSEINGANKHSKRGALQPLDPVKRKVVVIIQSDQRTFQLRKPYITYTSVPAPSFLLVEFSFYQCAHVKH